MPSVIKAVIATWILLAATCLMIAWFIVATTPPSKAGEPDRATWFKSLTQPDTGLNCCDIADCGEAKATFQRGQWWVTQVIGRRPPEFAEPFTIYEGPALPVNPHKILTEPPSIDGRAYACIVFEEVRCFVPPAMGS